MPAKLVISSNVGEITCNADRAATIKLKGERDRSGVMVAFGGQGLKRFSPLSALSGVSAFSGVRHGR